MKAHLIACLLLIVYSQLPEEPPPKFGLLTVTRARNNSFATLVDYLTFYTESQCHQKLISEVCIIWNNQLLPEEAGILQRQLYRRVPVYFYFTKNNSLNHRFRLPKQATSELFYSLDDDIRVDCKTLSNTYKHYLEGKNVIPGRIVSNEVRNFGYFTTKKSQFYYQGHSQAQFYSIAETGASFFPKHYLSLYYLKLHELELLRERVENIASCEDIFFMAITQHFYPQMIPQYRHPQEEYKNTNPKVGLSRKNGLVSLRTSCFSFLSQVFGYNPLRQFSKDSTKYKNNFQFPNINLIMQTKIQGLIKVEMELGNQRDISSSIKPFLASINSNQNQKSQFSKAQQSQSDQRIQQKINSQQKKQAKIQNQKNITIKQSQEIFTKIQLKNTSSAKREQKMDNKKLQKYSDAQSNKTDKRSKLLPQDDQNRTQDSQLPSGLVSLEEAKNKFNMIVIILGTCIFILLGLIWWLLKVYWAIKSQRSKKKSGHKELPSSQEDF